MNDRGHRAQAAPSGHALNTHAAGAGRHRSRTNLLWWECRALWASTIPCSSTPWAVWGSKERCHNKLAVCRLEPIAMHRRFLYMYIYIYKSQKRSAIPIAAHAAMRIAGLGVNIKCCAISKPIILLIEGPVAMA
jgi:hypothetical protein